VCADSRKIRLKIAADLGATTKGMTVEEKREYPKPETRADVLMKLHNEPFTWLPSDKKLKAALAKIIKAITKN
jgi:hypothetical protein